jgi:hypothetical protein
MPPYVLEIAEWIAKIGGALLVLGGILTGIYSAVRSVGRSVGKFIDEKVLPPISKLTESVDELAARTHENTESLAGFAKEQSEINLRTATAIAEVRGHLGILNND